jgi:uncharacterized protein YigA (DUF484 family)
VKLVLLLVVVIVIVYYVYYSIANTIELQKLREKELALDRVQLQILKEEKEEAEKELNAIEGQAIQNSQ